jgi:hypothetical protein
MIPKPAPREEPSDEEEGCNESYDDPKEPSIVELRVVLRRSDSELEMCHALRGRRVC